MLLEWFRLLFGSSIFLMAPEMHADDLWTMNSKPSLLTRVTKAGASAMLGDVAAR